MTAETSEQLSPEKYDAIHRALLTGLLGNIGFKSDSHEYSGAQGNKFSIFPGSGLFRKEPKWIVAAEIVETTRLYARTVARIQPEWVERLAGHLVKRTYSEPRWEASTAHVLANEKVMLHGLVLVPMRTVHFGPINPAMSRELFIHHALVEGEYRSTAPFFTNNRKLKEEIEALEAKTRQRNLLKSPQERFVFFETRIPQGIYNGPLFEKWRRAAERENPRLLFMSRADVMVDGAECVAGELFPDSLTVNGMKLPLEYHLEPGHPIDGVTVAVPLAAINQLPDAQFDWLVPGLLEEKIVALIRGLPKQLRTNFIPAADFAGRAAREMPFAQGSLLESVSRFLGKLGGIAIGRDAWESGALTDHLKMNFRIIDVAGKQLASGRDLGKIRRQLGSAAQNSFAAVPQAEFHRDGITHWDFGDLPACVEVKRHGMTLQGYPALVDAGTSVSLRLLDSPESAAAAMRGGARRLFMLQTREEFRAISRSLPSLERMSLHFSTLGKAEDLKNQLLAAIADRAFFAEPGEVRTREEFVRRCEKAWRRLNVVAGELGPLIEEILASYQSAAKELARSVPPLMAANLKDMREQLAQLIGPDFLTRTPAEWLPHLPRFLRGIEVRFKKLMNAGLARDNQHLVVVAPLWKNYLARATLHRERGIGDSNLTLYRWMLEELRVSVFAQELKTSVPVSAKRLEAIWAIVRNPGVGRA